MEFRVVTALDLLEQLSRQGELNQQLQGGGLHGSRRERELAEVGQEELARQEEAARHENPTLLAEEGGTGKNELGKRLASVEQENRKLKAESEELKRGILRLREMYEELAIIRRLE